MPSASNAEATQTVMSVAVTRSIRAKVAGTIYKAESCVAKFGRSAAFAKATAPKGDRRSLNDTGVAHLTFLRRGGDLLPMRASGVILAIVCAGVPFADVRVTRAQEATSANLPDQFHPWELNATSKSKKKKAESSSQSLATAPKQNVAPASQQTPATEELPTVMPAEEKHPQPSQADEARTNLTAARVAKSAPPPEESAPDIAPVETKPRPKKRPRPAMQSEATSVSPPVPMSLSVAQSMAIRAPLPEYTYEAKRRNLTGSGTCLVTVDPATGTVTDARMYQSTGSTMLDKLTIQTFKSWRFKSGTVSQVRVPISYE
jgi:TonB family protein